MSLLALLDRTRTIAKPGFSRWMAPPAALCIHLCIGEAYAFSVFNLPMTKLIGIGHSAPSDWKLTQLGWIFSIAIFVLGVSAAAFGRWVEECGPRKAMFTAGLCWASGFLVSALGVQIHQLWVVYLGYGVLGGLGLGIGYISPVSTLIKWFPDRPGMATGMAIMGFGGFAFIASPLSVWLIARFSTPTHIGVAETLICLGLIYLLSMSVGAAMIRVPPPGWKPQGNTAPILNRGLVSNNDVYVYDAIKTPQFWLIWWVLCLNVTGGYRRAQPSLRNEPGNVPGQSLGHCRRRFRRLAQPVQYARPFPVGIGFRLHWPQEHLLFNLRARHLALLPCAMEWLDRPHLAVRALLRGNLEHVWRRLRDRPGLPKGYVRYAVCWRHPRLADHRLVGGRNIRSGSGKLRSRVSNRSWCAEGPGLRCYHVCNGGIVSYRTALQSVRQARKSTLPFEATK